jgi:hypothetical protein
MSMTQTLIGGVALVAFGTLVVDVVTPDSPAIMVHDLRYENGFIFQDRTVIPENGGQSFYAFWAATIIDTQTGQSVCTGSGSFPYQAGRRDIPIPLSEWVGEPCDLPPGEYQPLAVWNWGYDQTSHAGQEFTVEGTGE